MSDHIKDDGVDNINYEELSTLIRNWVHYSKLSATLSKQYKNTQELSEIYEKRINDYLMLRNIENAKIKTTEGTMRFTQETCRNDLTLSSLEHTLNGYFSQKNKGENETKNIMKYIHEHRNYSVTRKLRKC